MEPACARRRRTPVSDALALRATSSNDDAKATRTPRTPLHTNGMAGDSVIHERGDDLAQGTTRSALVLDACCMAPGGGQRLWDFPFRPDHNRYPGTAARHGSRIAPSTYADLSAESPEEGHGLRCASAPARAAEAAAAAAAAVAAKTAVM